MEISQNEPLEKFMLAKMFAIILCGATNLYDTNLCDRRLTGIIYTIKLAHKNVALWYTRNAM
jgi:hypothetical protein